VSGGACGGAGPELGLAVVCTSGWTFLLRSARTRGWLVLRSGQAGGISSLPGNINAVQGQCSGLIAEALGSCDRSAAAIVFRPGSLLGRPTKRGTARNPSPGLNIGRPCLQNRRAAVVPVRGPTTIPVHSIGKLRCSFQSL